MDEVQKKEFGLLCLKLLSKPHRKGVRAWFFLTCGRDGMSHWVIKDGNV